MCSSSAGAMWLDPSGLFGINDDPLLGVPDVPKLPAPPPPPPGPAEEGASRVNRNAGARSRSRRGARLGTGQLRVPANTLNLPQ